MEFFKLNILECGACAADETDEFITTNNCYYIEASLQDYIKLKNENYNVVHYALTDIDNSNIEFTITSLRGNSSVNHSEIHKHELIADFNSSFTKTTVPATTYKNYIENIIKTNIDILVLDIEGHECAVLNTFYELEKEQLPKIICIEAGYDWLERKKILLDLGYVIDFYEFNNCYLSHSTCVIEKNVESMQMFNNNNKKLIWNDRVIYENENV
jgi:FkbM family methyltransferase